MLVFWILNGHHKLEQSVLYKVYMNKSSIKQTYSGNC